MVAPDHTAITVKANSEERVQAAKLDADKAQISELLGAASGLLRLEVGQTLIRGLPPENEVNRAYRQASAGFAPGVRGDERGQREDRQQPAAHERVDLVLEGGERLSGRAVAQAARSAQHVHASRPGLHPRVTLPYAQRNSKARASTASKRREARPTQCSTRLMLAHRK